MGVMYWDCNHYTIMDYNNKKILLTLYIIIVHVHASGVHAIAWYKQRVYNTISPWYKLTYSLGTIVWKLKNRFLPQLKPCEGIQAWINPCTMYTVCWWELSIIHVHIHVHAHVQFIIQCRYPWTLPLYAFAPSWAKSWTKPWHIHVYMCMYMYMCMDIQCICILHACAY